ncbi:DUF7210 family protein [Salmonella enterica]
MKVVLLKPHTHLKTHYEKGAELEIPYGPAEWMIQHDIAKKAPAHKPTEDKAE